VDDDCIRLTSYFRERQRAEGRAIADALTGLYASREVAASIVLRGTEGLSAATAVSPRPDMGTLLSQVVELAGPGLVTVEQARLLTGDIDPVWLGEQPGEATMLTIHCGRQDHVYQVPAFEAVCELLYRHGIAGACVLPGTGGTLRGRRRHLHPYRHDDDAPVMVIAVGSDNEMPVHRAIARQLAPNGLEATTVRGIWGFHAEHAPHGDRFPHRAATFPLSRR
jgi:PII-like signaling protein